MTDTASLIETLEYAHAGSRGLDVRIAACVKLDRKDIHGRRFVDVFERFGWEQMAKEADSWCIPHFSTSFDAAETLFPERWVLARLRRGPQHREYQIKLSLPVPESTSPKEGRQSAGRHAKLPLALCIASLRATIA
ncbi:hypothetical protein [Ferrovibrio sp.]|uniref:hypothetical protein n=1 Tax=Ferrovibrio sp. TaxID=1917215 RepID=UPI00311F4EDC